MVSKVNRNAMKLPAASCGVSLKRNCAEAPLAFALTSYGAVASPFLSAASFRVSWRRRMNFSGKMDGIGVDTHKQF